MGKFYNYSRKETSLSCSFALIYSENLVMNKNKLAIMEYDD